MTTNGVMKTICAVCTIVFISCAGTNSTSNNSKIPKDNIVGYVDGTPVSYEEFKEGYLSGSLNEDYTLEELEDFLPTYLNYKAKLTQAKDLGYFDQKSILEEYDLYSKQAAYAYWMDEHIKPTKFNEFKERYSKEMKSSHILIAVNPSAPPTDTLAAYNKLIEARDKYLSGEATMAQLDSAYSSVREGRSMGGELPWFSVGTTVKPFEDVLYSLEKGEISMPFRTQFGYHIILLEDVRERVPSRMISHIFAGRDSNPAKLDTAYKRLMNGADWDAMVTDYTEDRLSMRNGGNIGWINYGARYHPDFINLVMDLDPEIEITEPIRTPYGTHIFRMDSIQTFKNEAEKDEFLRKELEKTNAVKTNNSTVINWIRDNYLEIVHLDNFEAFKASIDDTDSTKFEEYEFDAEVSDLVLYTFQDYEFTASDFEDYLKEKYGTQPAYKLSDLWFSAFQKASVDNILAEFTRVTYPEFEIQTQGYLKGLVVYQINEDSVWSSATVDTSRLKSIYDSNIEEYSYPVRYYYHMITSRQDSNIQKAIDFVEAGNSPDSIRANNIPVGVVSDSTGAFQGEPFDRLEQMEVHTFSSPFEYNNRNAVFYLNEILPARSMTFDEAFNRIMADYQPVREENWLENLNKTYDIQAFPERVKLNYEKEHIDSE